MDEIFDGFQTNEFHYFHYKTELPSDQQNGSVIL
jgi:hypothetical protein